MVPGGLVVSAAPVVPAVTEAAPAAEVPEDAAVWAAGAVPVVPAADDNCIKNTRNICSGYFVLLGMLIS